ncbi:MAG: methylmalonyl Co-A mutase-associated GTPase MeaB [Thermodesulfobacteriota bacterium]
MSEDKDTSYNSKKPSHNPLAPSDPGGKVIKFKKKKPLTLENYVNGISNGDRVILSQAITKIESTIKADIELSQKIIDNCLPLTGNSIRIGITGVPGVGKSTFIEALGNYIIENSGQKVAVLAIDPTSQKSKGSILGDKTRMEKLSQNPYAFIRPSASGGSIGGVAKKTREAIFLCEAAGFNTIIVETVGVGQSETSVNSMVDFFLLLLLAGAGDELQGIKRGVMEMADCVAITKADGENKQMAEIAKKQYENALKLYPVKENGWVAKVIKCSSITMEGISDIWETVQNHHNRMNDTGYLDRKRQDQSILWMHETIISELKDSFYNNSRIKNIILELEDRVKTGEISPFKAANKLLDIYFSLNPD